MNRPTWQRRDLSFPFQGLQTELNRLFDEYWQPQGQQTPRASTAVDRNSWRPNVDLDETPQEWLLSVDLPGVDPSTIDLSVSGDVLTIKGERTLSHPAGGQARNRERVSGPFSRQITLGEGVDSENVQAEARHGVLYIRMPRRQAAKPRTIPVQHG
ncbi:Hsp20/alpha crystallin family protein [Isosphaeraceae bacterium EP7]